MRIGDQEGENSYNESSSAWVRVKIQVRVVIHVVYLPYHTTNGKGYTYQQQERKHRVKHSIHFLKEVGLLGRRLFTVEDNFSICACVDYQTEGVLGIFELTATKQDVVDCENIPLAVVNLH